MIMERYLSVCIVQQLPSLKDTSARRQQLQREKRLIITMGWLAGATLIFHVGGNFGRTYLVSFVEPSMHNKISNLYNLF
jgi:hypothetical protein